MNKKVKVVVINKEDNVGITLSESLAPGEELWVNERKIVVLNPIPVGHKIALVDIPLNGYVVKFGEIIGKVKYAIKAGEHVHVHNVEDITELLSKESMERL